MKIIFGLPGNHFSGRFLECWTRMVDYCWQQGIQYAVSRNASSNVYYVRNMCLGGDVLRGAEQKPQAGQRDASFAKLRLGRVGRLNDTLRFRYRASLPALRF